MAESIFITGGTGFLGTALCAELLRTTDADLYLLLRAKAREEADHRLREAFQRDADLYAAIEKRVFPVIGDLTKDSLGLSPEDAALLREKVTLVFHAAAEIGFQKGQEELTRANCLGTENLLSFAGTLGKLRLLVHVSTAFVAGQTEGRILEGQIGTSFSSLYEKSKAEAEELVRSSSLPYCICRPGMIVGDSRTGYVKNFNTVYYLLKQLLLGKLPLLPIKREQPLCLVPVDYVAEAVAKAGFREGVQGKTFHLTCPGERMPTAGELTDFVVKWARENLSLSLSSPVFLPLGLAKKAGLAYNQKAENRRKGFLTNLLTLLPYGYSSQDFDRSGTDALLGPYSLSWRDYLPALLAFACRKSFMRQTGQTVFEQALVRRRSTRYPIRYYDITEKEILSYSGEEVNARVLAAAHALLSWGIVRGDRVALTGINSVDYLVLEQAIGLIGAVSVPIYYTTPMEEVSLLLTRSGSNWFFVGDKRIMAHIGELTLPVQTVAFSVARGMEEGVMDWEAFLAKGGSSKADSLPASYAEPDDLATIRYTSGTTGEPKGVMFCCRQLTWMGEVLAELLPWETRNKPLRYLSFLPQSHVVEGILASYAPYYLLSQVDYYYLNDFGALTKALPKVRPTVFFSVPRFYEKLWEQIEQNRLGKLYLKQKDGAGKRLLGKLLKKGVLKKAGLDACSQLIVGSAPVSEALLLRFRELGIEIHNAYGQTEAPLITINRVGDNVIPTIGTALPETKIWAEPDGELIVEGPQVAMGYYGLSTDTIRDGVLRTGDLGILHEDGHITLRGRKKEMIVTAYGKNISIPKLEERLKSLPGVSEAVLIGENRPYCTALLWLAEEKNEGAEEKGKTEEQRVERERKRLQAEIDRMNTALSHPEQIRRFQILTRPLGIQAGELTPNLKVKRAVVEEHFREEIEEMYR